MGGGSYQPKTRIGNWNEDAEQEEFKFAKYLEAKQNGELVSHRLATKNNRSRQRVPLAYKAEGEPICFGDRIMLQSTPQSSFCPSNLLTGESGSCGQLLTQRQWPRTCLS